MDPDLEESPASLLGDVFPIQSKVTQHPIWATAGRAGESPNLLDQKVLRVTVPVTGSFQASRQVLGAHPASFAVNGFLLGDPAERRLSAEADSLDVEIRELAKSGAFAEATELARELRSVDERSGADTFQLRWYDIWIESLDDAAALSQEAQADLARANRIEPEAVLAYSNGRFTDHDALRREQAQLRSQWLGDDHPEVAYPLIFQARGLLQLGRIDEAEATIRRSHRILEGRFGPEHFLTNTSRGFLATVARERGDFAQAEQLQREVIAIVRSLGKAGQRQLTGALFALIEILKAQGDFDSARQLLHEALDTNRHADYEWMPNPEGYRMAEESALLEALAGLLIEQGNYSEGERYAQQALAMHEGGDPIRRAKSLTLVARAMTQLNRFDDARDTYRQVLDLRRGSFGEKHVLVAETLADLASLDMETGRLTVSLDLTKRAHDMYAELLGSDHPSTLRALDDYVFALLAADDLPGAERFAELAVQLHSQRGGRSRDGRAQLHLGRVHLARGRLAEARQALTESAKRFEESRLRAGDGVARATFEQSPYAHLAASFLYLEDTASAWLALERGQGRALLDLLTASGDRHLPYEAELQLRSAVRKLDLAEKESAALEKAARTDLTPEVRSQLDASKGRVLAATAEFVQLQSEIAKTHPVPLGQPCGLERIWRSLDKDEALLGWLDVPMLGDDNLTWGYVIRKNEPVRWVVLPEPETTTDRNLYEQFRTTLTRPLTSMLRGSGAGAGETWTTEARRLFDLRIEPLLPWLDDAQSIVVVGGGPVSGLPIETCLDEAGQTMGDQYAISYAPSATVFAWLSEKRSRGGNGRDIDGRDSDGRSSGGRDSNGRAGNDRVSHGRVSNGHDSDGRESSDSALLLGDPPFREEHLSTNPKADLPWGGIPLSTLRSALGGDSEALASLPRLRWSRLEVETLATHFDEPLVLVGTDATESRLAALSESGDLRGYGTIHLATHALVDSHNPWRSALVVSQLETQKPFIDGLVTARDIIRFWDLDADLVVLSACETGLGRHIVGEGYVGFAQAFFQAGARSVLASLWKVDDRATALLMERFYREWRGGATKVDALRTAKKALRESKDGPDFSHPAYWSAFVLLGNPD